MKNVIQKKTVKRLIACLLFLFLLWQLFSRISYLFRNTDENRMAMLNYFAQADNSIDVIYIGASSVVVSWNTMEAYHEYGIASYDYSVADLPAQLLITAVKEIQKTQTQTPRVIVIDVCKFISRIWSSTIYAGYRRFTDSMDYGLDRLLAIDSYRRVNNISLDDSISSFIDIIYYHNNYDSLANGKNWNLRGNMVSEEDTSNKRLFKGYVATKIGVLPFPGYEVPDTDQKTVLDPAIEKSYRALLDYCSNKNMPVLLTFNPYIILHEEDWLEANALADIAEEYGISFWNGQKYWDEIGLNALEDFHDAHHVNYLGSIKYTDFFASYLKELYDLPDRRLDPAYASWNEMYDNIYLSYMEGIKENIISRAKSISETLQNEIEMRNTDDPLRWLSLADDSNLMLLIYMPLSTANPPALDVSFLLRAFGMPYASINRGNPFVGVYSGESLYASNTNKEYSNSISMPTGKDDINYSVGSGAIMINKTDYFSGEEYGIHIVAIDKNTTEVVDSVILDITGTGGLTLTHINL